VDLEDDEYWTAAMHAAYNVHKDCFFLLQKYRFQRLLWKLPGPVHWRVNLTIQESDYENISPKNILLKGLNHGGDLGLPKALVQFMLKWM